MIRCACAASAQTPGRAELKLPDPGLVADQYDEALAAVVKSYQETKGLSVDGVIGAKTIRSLNTTIDERIEQIVTPTWNADAGCPRISAAATSSSTPATIRWCSSMLARLPSRAW